MGTSQRPGPALAVVHDIPASWHDYHRVAVALTDGPTPGLLIHVAGPTDDGIRTIDVWESEHAWQTQRHRWHEQLAGLYSPPIASELPIRHLVGVLTGFQVGDT
jgi:hypothetical protein